MGCSHEFASMIGICTQRSKCRITDVSLTKRFLARKQEDKTKKAIITIMLSAFHDLACKICSHKIIHHGNTSVKTQER